MGHDICIGLLLLLLLNAGRGEEIRVACNLSLGFHLMATPYNIQECSRAILLANKRGGKDCERKEGGREKDFVDAKLTDHSRLL